MLCCLCVDDSVLCSVLFSGIAQVECVMSSVVMAADVLETLVLIFWGSLESKSCIMRLNDLNLHHSPTSGFFLSF